MSADHGSLIIEPRKFEGFPPGPESPTAEKMRNLPRSKPQPGQKFEVGNLPLSKQRHGAYPFQHFVEGTGVAIFHVATSRVVVCYHPVEKHWFLPKGRRDRGETTEVAACREGFEESGYRNRLLPLPLITRQPKPAFPSDATEDEVNHDFMTEPVYLQLLELGGRNQYYLTWYIAETVPPEIETSISAKEAQSDKRSPYTAPPPFPKNLRLTDRMALEPDDYEPVRHEGMGVDDDEALYQSYLLPVEEACKKLSWGIMSHVVRVGWAAILERLDWEHSNQKTN